MHHQIKHGGSWQSNQGDGCRHHWLIEPPDGPISRGVCKKCGARRNFMNTPVELLSDSSVVPSMVQELAGAA